MGSAETIAPVDRNLELTHVPRAPDITLVEATNTPTVTTETDPISPRFLPFKPSPTPPTEAQIIGLANLYMIGDFPLTEKQARKKAQFELTDIYCIDVSGIPTLIPKTVLEAEPVLIFSTQKQLVPEQPALERPAAKYKPVPRFFRKPLTA